MSVKNFKKSCFQIKNQQVIVLLKLKILISVQLFKEVFINRVSAGFSLRAF